MSQPGRSQTGSLLDQLSVGHEESPAQLSLDGSSESITRHTITPGMLATLAQSGPDTGAEITDVLPPVLGDGPHHDSAPDPAAAPQPAAEPPEAGRGAAEAHATTTEAHTPARTRLQEKRRQQRHRTRLVAKAAVSALAAVIFLSTGAVWGAISWYDGRLEQVAALDTNSPAVQDQAAQHGDTNFLIVGSDSRSEAADGAGYGSQEEVDGERADTVMLAHVPTDGERAVFVSFPRDLEVSLNGCAQWDDTTRTYSDGVTREANNVKLGDAYEAGGPRCITDVIQEMSGLRVNHFAAIDFLGFKEMVDAVHGVDITVDEPIIDGVLGTVVDEPGTHTVGGNQALSFVRARHVEGDPTSDYGRMQRQQQFVSALVDKTLSRETLLDPAKLSELASSFNDATFGDNVGVDELLSLTESVSRVGIDDIEYITVPTTGFANTRGNEVLLEGEAGELFDSLIENTPLTGRDS